MSLPDSKISAIWNFSSKQDVLRVQEKHIKLKSPISLEQKILPLDRVEARSTLFTELQSYWTVPISDTAVVAGLSVNLGTKGDGTDDVINVLVTNPLKIFSIIQESDRIQETALHGLINSTGGNRLRFTMVTDSNQNVLVYEETVSNFYIK